MCQYGQIAPPPCVRLGRRLDDRPHDRTAHDGVAFSMDGSRWGGTGHRPAIQNPVVERSAHSWALWGVQLGVSDGLSGLECYSGMGWDELFSCNYILGGS